MAIIDIKNLSFSYSGSDRKALNSLTLSVDAGEFVVICGQSGCGKSTLTRMLKKALAPKGSRQGQILYNGVNIDEFSERDAATKVGFVMQDPDSQIATDKVWHELAFGLESLGEDSETIRRKVAEICGYFGISDWYHSRTDELSGGQKQLLNLASVMTMQPEVLVLDEPTSQLDPIAASNFIATLKKLNYELSLTIIIVEHRLEEVFPIADKVVILKDGSVFLHDEPRRIGGLLRDFSPSDEMLLALPTAVRVFFALGGSCDCPLSVRDGRNYLQNNFKNPTRVPENGENLQENGEVANLKNPTRVPENGENLQENGEAANLKNPTRVPETGENLQENSEVANLKNPTRVPENGENLQENGEFAIEIKDAYFRYERDLPDILNGLSLEVRRGEFLCILGANGIGKTTLLGVFSGLNRIYSGKLRIFSKKLKSYTGASLYRKNVAYLPQNPSLVFVKDRLYDDLAESTKLMGYDTDTAAKKIGEICKKLKIDSLLDRHPYDLSGGEQQRAATAKLLLLEAKILLMDEPTKGIDAHAKKVLAEILADCKKDGITVVMVTHDVEFAAEYSDRSAMFFDGKIVSVAEPREFFCQNSFYTTSASRMSRGIFYQTVTVEQIVKNCNAFGEVSE